MTKERILSVFEDINVMYNNPNMYDTLKRMLDELTENESDGKKCCDVCFYVPLLPFVRDRDEWLKCV